MLGWSAGGDPDNFFYYLLSKTTAQKPALNIAFYRSDEMQDVLERCADQYRSRRTHRTLSASISHLPQRRSVGSLGTCATTFGY